MVGPTWLAGEGAAEVPAGAFAGCGGGAAGGGGAGGCHAGVVDAGAIGGPPPAGGTAG